MDEQPVRPDRKWLKDSFDSLERPRFLVGASSPEEFDSESLPREFFYPIFEEFRIEMSLVAHWGKFWLKVAGENLERFRLKEVVCDDDRFSEWQEGQFQGKDSVLFAVGRPLRGSRLTFQFEIDGQEREVSVDLR